MLLILSMQCHWIAGGGGNDGLECEVEWDLAASCCDGGAWNVGSWDFAVFLLIQMI